MKQPCIFPTWISLIQFKGCLLVIFLHFLIPDIGDSWNDRHKWTNAKIDHVPFTCSWFVMSRKWAHRCITLAEIMFRKYQQISANFSNCDGVYFQKRIISKTGECVLKKRTLQQLFCYIATLISSKLWKFPVHSLIRRDFSFSFDFSQWRVQLCSIVKSSKKVERQICSRSC